MSSRMNLSRPRSSSGGCIKSGITATSYVARGSTTTVNSTRHIHCFHNKTNNSSPFSIPTSPPLTSKTATLQNLNLVTQGCWTLAGERQGESCNNIFLTTTASSTTFISQTTDSPSAGEEFVKKPGKNMAGDIRIVDSKRRTRRHWTLRDRSNMSVHLLKANLAEEGCEESQLDVAKKLLQDSRDPELLESAQRENSRLAVYWLVKSSEQGNIEATKLLQECLTSGHGITAQNLPDVSTCVKTPTNEKLTYKAARQLYLKLNNGEKFITTTQLLSRIESPNKRVVHFAEETDPESNQDSLNSTITDGDEVGEGDVMNAKLNETFTYQSSLPVADDNVDELNTPEILSVNCSNQMNQEGVKLTLEDLLKCASLFNAGESPRPAINRNWKELGRHVWKFGSQFNGFCVQLLLLCAITEAVSFYNCVLLAAALLSLWASFNLLRWNKTHSNFKDWSKAFDSISHDYCIWSDENPEERLISNSLTPYLTGLILSTTAFSTLDGLNSLKLVSGCLVTFALLRGRETTQSHRFPSIKLIGFLTILNFPSVLFLCLEYTKGLQLDLHIDEFVPDYITKLMESSAKTYQELMEVNLPFVKDRFVLMIQIVAIASLLIGSFKKTVLQKSLPDFLIAFWISKILKIILLQLQQQDDNYLQIVCIELTIIATIISVILIIQSQLGYSKMIFSVAFVLLMGSASATIISTTMEGNLLQMTITNLRLHSKKQVGAPNELKYENIHDIPLLEWETYDESCHRKAWKIHNLSPAFTQLSCFDKYGKIPTAVIWKGKVSLVKIREITRSPFSTEVNGVSFDIIVNLMTPDTSPESGPSSWQQFFPGSVEHHGEIDPPSPALILVSSTIRILGGSNAKQETIDFIVSLKNGDKIEFHGLLSSHAVGSLRPEIENVQSIKCIACAFQGKSQEEVFIHRTNQHLNRPKSTTKFGTKSQSTTSNERIYQSFQSLFNQMKELITELVSVVKNKF